MSDATGIAKAFFTIVRRGGGSSTRPVPVHFNPASLQQSITNTLSQQGGTKKQYVTQSSAKLTMDLIYDTSDKGTDVRADTSQVAKLMEPKPDPDDPSKKIPPVVAFEWGAFRFQGMVESYKETIDFFAPAGVPLRATVNLTLAKQDKVFEAERGRGRRSAEQVVPLRAEGDDATAIASQGGAPTAARRLAASNGFESMRFLSGPALAVSGAVALE